MQRYHTIIIGAGAAGLFCAGRAVAAGPVLVIDHAAAPAEKVRISGGGRCNFTNFGTRAECFIAANPHFAKSALARFTPQDFLDLVQRHGIGWHEKARGQLFCDGSARQIIEMLLALMRPAELRLGLSVTAIEHGGDFTLTLSDGALVRAANLVIATGGKSIPKMGASDMGYRIARQFGLEVTETRAGLVPLTFGPAEKALFASLAGVSLPVAVRHGRRRFDDALLFTHRGLSGPAILQISSYWREGDSLALDLLPGRDIAAALRTARAESGRRGLAGALALHMPARLAALLAEEWQLAGNLADWSDARLAALADRLSNWVLRPAGSEGYRTAEVTVGGVATTGLDARTMRSRVHPGLYFIGEVVDVTGWLGGYNFQWAWASAHAAGTAIANGG